MSSVYKASEELIVNSEELLLEKISLADWWNAEWGYKIKLKVESWKLKVGDLVWLLKRLWVAQNITKKNLTEIISFLNKNSSGHKFLNGVTFFVSHGEIYLIKARRDFWKEKINEGLMMNNEELFRDENTKMKWKRRYPRDWDRFHGKSWNQFCSRQKIPIFWRNRVPVCVEGETLVGYFWEGKICK